MSTQSLTCISKGVGSYLIKSNLNLVPLPPCSIIPNISHWDEHGGDETIAYCSLFKVWGSCDAFLRPQLSDRVFHFRPMHCGNLWLHNSFLRSSVRQCPVRENIDPCIILALPICLSNRKRASWKSICIFWFSNKQQMSHEMKLRLKISSNV